MITREQLELFETIDEGVKQGVREAIEEHRRAGRSIVICRDGKIVHIPPEDIPRALEEASK